jgi:hypothetical protein
MDEKPAGTTQPSNAEILTALTQLAEHPTRRAPPGTKVSRHSGVSLG